jgi:hypothetical protein
MRIEGLHLLLALNVRHERSIPRSPQARCIKARRCLGFFIVVFEFPSSLTRVALARSYPKAFKRKHTSSMVLRSLSQWQFPMKSQLLGKPPTLSHIGLPGQTAIITGSTTGIGFHSCVHFLAHELSHLIMAVRSTSNGEAVALKLLVQFPAAKIEV